MLYFLTQYRKLTTYHHLPLRHRIQLSFSYTLLMMSLPILFHIIFESMVSQYLIISIYIYVGLINFLWCFAIIEPRFMKVYHILTVVSVFFFIGFMFFFPFVFRITGNTAITETFFGETIRVAHFDLVRTMLGFMCIIFVTLGTMLYAKVIEFQAELQMKINTEILIARNLQSEFVPLISIDDKKIKAFGLTSPASDAGGDYVDVIYNNGYHFIIGDVSGHGIGTIVAVGMLKSVIRAQVFSGQTLDAMTKTLNQTFYGYHKKKMFISLTSIRIDSESNQMQAVNAGHIPFIMYNAQDNKFEAIQIKSTAVGLTPQSKYTVLNRQIGRGDKILLLTDGIIECTDNNNEEFGFDRVKESFERNISKSPEEIVNLIIEEVSIFKTHNHDDFSVMCVELKS